MTGLDRMPVVQHPVVVPEFEQQPRCPSCGSPDPLKHPATPADYDGGPEAGEDGLYVIHCPDRYHLDHIDGQPVVTIRPAGGLL